MTSESTVPQAVDQLTLATLYLCNISYYADITTIPAAVGGTPVLNPGPQWRCLWGPAQDSDESNLAFVAGYFPSANPTPQNICVTVRGTDVDIDDIWGIFYQIWEDLDATPQCPLPWAKSDPTRQRQRHVAGDGPQSRRLSRDRGGSVDAQPCADL